MSGVPSPSVVLRRSPRSIAKLCNGTKMEGLTSEQTAVLLSLAHCTGWSADRVRLKIKEETHVDIKAEDVWSFHWRWVMDRGKQHTVRAEEVEVMQCVLRGLGITLTSMGRPLHATQQPISVEFMAKWSPKTYDGRPLCKGFTVVAREQAKAFLYTQKLSEFGKLCPSEEIITQQFGATVETLIKETLKNWGKALRAKLRDDGPYKALKEREHVQLIMDHLKKYHDCYEALYGLMEDSRIGGQLGHIKDNTVYIRSTGYGVKVLIGLMMADRLHVIDKFRREERERISYESVPASDLPDDSKNCPICQDPLDTETPEGTSEQALKLIICCGQVIGESCLKAWLAQSGRGVRKNCPTCRFQFTPGFMEKLFEGEEPWLEGEDSEEDDDIEDAIVVDAPAVVDLVSPSPEPQEASASASASAPADMTRLVFMNSVHTHIPRGLDGLPDVGAAVSVGGAEAGRTDDFMMEG